MNFTKNILFVIILSVATAVVTSSFAKQTLISDPNVITGTLANGLTYHLYKSNDEAKDDHDEEVALRLYVKIGSLDENDQQKGYAHLVEHLGFRDSRYFTHKQKDAHLENLGLHTNAYTTYNRTVYYVNDRNPTPARMAKHIKLFRDFADGMFITKSDFEVERKIVLEELRLRAAKKDGISDKLLKIYDNGQYLDDKKPIGTKQVLNAATHESVKAFFTKWYQPQHMHLVITGQIDIKKLEQQIKDEFGQIKQSPAVKDATPNYKLPTGIHFATANDSTGNGIGIIIPLPKLETKIVSSPSYQNTIAYDFIVGGMDSDIHRSNDNKGKLVPYISTNYSFEESRAYLDIYIQHKEGERNKAIKFALTEIATLRQHGFNQSQFENQITYLKKRIDKPFSAFKHDGRPAHIADDIIANLDSNEINISEDAEQAEVEKFINNLNRDKINAQIKQILQNSASLIVVSREQVSEQQQAESSQLIDAFNAQSMAFNASPTQNVSDKQLNYTQLKAGKVAAEKTIKNSDVKQFSLSNGAKLYLLKRKKDEGEVSIAAYAKGGSESLPARLIPASQLAAKVITANGIGGLTENELGEFLYKQSITSLHPFIGENLHGYIVNLEKTKGFEDALKVLHMGFYQGKVHQELFKAIKETSAKSYDKWYKTEDGEFSKAISNGIIAKGIDYYLISGDQLRAVTEADIVEVYQHLYSDLSKFSFVVAGDFEQAKVIQLFEQHIANIPSKTVDYAPPVIKLHKGPISIRKNNNPKQQSRVTMTFNNKAYDNSNFENNVAHVIAASVLKKRIYDIMRKEEGLTYTVGVRFSINEGSVESSDLGIRFSVKPSNEKKAIAIVNQALADLKTKPITQKEFIDKRDKVLESHQKVRASNASNVNYIGRKFALGYSLEEVAILEDKIMKVPYEKARDLMVEFLDDAMKIKTVFSDRKN